jgi:hypothetical protein
VTSPARDERLIEIDLPREVWSKSRRPVRGAVMRATVAAAFALAGLGMPGTAAMLGMVVLGIAVFLAVPVIVDGRLQRIGAATRGLGKAAATDALRDLERPWMVAMFAPIAWIELQRGRLLLQQGDGRGAARALAECGRMCGATKHPALLGAQARAYALSGDRKEARALLVELDGAGKLDGRGHLDLAIVLLGDTGRIGRAQAHLDEAARELGDHPQVAAARALALVREDRPEPAAELLDVAERDAREDDPIAQELIKRARKLLRPALPAAKKAERADRGSPRPTAQERPEPRKAGGRKKDKRKERRQKRKQAAAEKAATGERAPSAAERAAAAKKDAADKAAAEKAAVERAAAEKAAVERAAAANAAAEKAAAEKAAVERAAAERAAVERAAAEKAAAEKAAAEKAAAEKAAAEKAAAEKAAVERAAAAKAAPVEAPGPVSPPASAVPKLGGAFRPPPIPATSATVPAPARAPATAPSIPAPPTVAPKAPVVPPPPKVASAPAKPEAAADDGWGDLLGDDEPPEPT